MAVVHAVTDAPAVDVVVAETGAVLADDLPYGGTAATALAPGTYRIEVRRSDTGALVEAVRFAIAGGSDAAVTLALTGFLNPAANQDGPPLALMAVDATGQPDGGVIVTGAEPGAAPGAAGTLAVVPNPARTAAGVRYAVAQAGPVRVTLYDVLGRRVATLVDAPMPAGGHAVALPVGALAPGAYVVRLEAAGAVTTRTLTVTR